LKSPPPTLSHSDEYGLLCVLNIHQPQLHSSKQPFLKTPQSSEFPLFPPRAHHPSSQSIANAFYFAVLAVNLSLFSFRPAFLFLTKLSSLDCIYIYLGAVASVFPWHTLGASKLSVKIMWQRRAVSSLSVSPLFLLKNFLPELLGCLFCYAVIYSLTSSQSTRAPGT
jgi:hypothetical protein